MRTEFDIAYYVQGGGTFWGTQYAEDSTMDRQILDDAWQEVKSSGGTTYVRNGKKLAAIKSESITAITVSRH